MEPVRFNLVSTDLDKGVLMHLIQTIWPNVYTPIIGQRQVEYMLTNFQSLAQIEKEILDGVKYYLLYKDGKAIGYTAFAEFQTEIYLSKFYFSQKVRGQGLAKQVFKWYEDLAGERVIRLNVNKYNIRAITIYEHYGFQRISSQVTEIGQGYVMDDYGYQKSSLHGTPYGQ